MKTVLYHDFDKYKYIRNHFYKLYKEKPLMAAMLRTTWHDAGTWDPVTKTGGPNGSLRFKKELDHHKNKGCEGPIKIIEKITTEVQKEIPDVSFSDVLMIAGNSAVEYAKGPDSMHLFRFGRIDATSDEQCPPDGRLPDANWSVQEIRDCFGRMGFYDKEVVVLSGAHTLGGAHKGRYGFQGDFTPSKHIFNNEFFQVMLKPRDPELLRLPSDDKLIEVPEWRYWVEKYAENQNLFFEDWIHTWNNLLELSWV